MSVSADSVIILAAGDGSRLKSSTPKVFHKVGGLSLLDHVIQTAKSINPCEIIAVLKPQYRDIELKFNANVKKAHQEIPKGTGDAVKCGLKSLSNNNHGWVYILYADIPLISATTLKILAETARKCEKTAVVVLAMNDEGTNNLGKLEPADEIGTIKGIIEAKNTLSADSTLPLCNAGLLIKKSVLRELIDKIKPNPVTGEFYITDIVKIAHNAGYVCRYHEACAKELFGANTRFELSILEESFQEKMRNRHMNNGVTLIAPNTVFFSYDTEIENDVVIYPYVVFLEHVFIKSGSHIGPFCLVEGSKIYNAQIGPFARLRPGSIIQDGAKIGNFVEIKNSIVNEKSKINHLSYVGDSTVGKNTNIGAGTITCNYDGFNKYETFIGENVFIGSNSALVAPLKICDNAMVGAGSVITKDVEDGALAIARGTQKNIKGWSKNFRKSRVCK
ncbi:MAG: bifunctional UDP-N-acetylglucosamine diphosphorylase/glucosamine-1-phosphate N-acetyltransferase GlmU [Holosporaceae bacterium]|nr:bifunctional UDP-N-acetylglucosamine diphosphorylase/glucosamine-1-phosphate N-acetyltransferase GlmU [Holosporaceae bacterium]